MLYDQDPQRSFMQKMSDFPVVVLYNGTNSMAGEITAVTSCNMYLVYFPKDVQTCQIKLAPLPIGIE